jgi:hypothetical protein
MPIFSRRRLQSMLNELEPHLTVAAQADLLARLEHKNTKDALAAEFEMALLWGMARVAAIQVAPKFANNRPDAMSANLFASAPALIEITALSDDTFSGQVDMDRAANIIAQFADRIRKGAGKHLYFEFQEANSFDGERFQRIRRVTPNFKLNLALEASIQTWIRSSHWPTPEAIRVTDEQIDVVIRWKQFVHPLFRAHSTMPAVAYDLKDNNLFRALEKKEAQLAGTPTGTLKCIFLADAGCRNLRYQDSSSVAEAGGKQIICSFLASSSIDIVCVFSPHRSAHPIGPVYTSPWWTATLYDRHEVKPAGEYSKVKALVESLPPPSFEGNQARALHRQGAFHPQANGRYLGTIIQSGRSSLTIKISSRLLQEALAGKISIDKFAEIAFGKDSNQFEYQLARGFTIQSSHIEHGGLDEDDDHLVLDFAADPSASALTNPKIIRG